MNPNEHLRRELIITVKQRNTSILTELERKCTEEWEIFPKCRYAKLVTSYPRRLDAVVAAKGDSTKY